MTKLIFFTIFLSVFSLVSCLTLPTIPNFKEKIFEPIPTAGRLLLSSEMLAFNASFYQTMSGYWNSDKLLAKNVFFRMHNHIIDGEF